MLQTEKDILEIPTKSHINLSPVGLDYFENAKYIKELTPNDFDEINSPNIKDKSDRFVMFYLIECPYCKKMKKNWEDLSNIITFCNIDAFNASRFLRHTERMQQQSNFFKTFPALVWYRNGKPIKRYDGPRDLGSLIREAITNSK